MKRATPPILDFAFVFSIALRVAAADGQPDSTDLKTNEPISYPWSETSDYARVPKSFLDQITIRPITMTNFETQVHVLTDEFIGIFKLTPGEVERVNASLAEALHAYRMEESRHLIPTGEVIANAPPLQRLVPHPAIERFTF